MIKKNLIGVWQLSAASAARFDAYSGRNEEAPLGKPADRLGGVLISVETGLWEDSNLRESYRTKVVMRRARLTTSRKLMGEMPPQQLELNALFQGFRTPFPVGTLQSTKVRW